MIKNNVAKSIYIHIPFCAKICYYCDFTKMIPQRVDDYIDALIEELNLRVNLDVEFETIYIGGGTPSILTTQQWNRLFKFLNQIKLSSNYEFSVEGNVETFTQDKLEFLFKNRVNRLSVGMQTLNDRLLKIINRDHNKLMFLNFLNLAKKIGFNQINVDLMFALPSQTLEEVQEDLNEMLSLKLTHVSIYSLILEKNSVFYKMRNKYNFVSEEEEFKMYELVLNVLKNNGYKHYEISNFCLNNEYSKHNLVYWEAKNYIGCGLGASGYLNNVRYENTKNINTYIKSSNNLEIISTQTEILNENDLKNEYMLLGLRKLTGISISEYKQRFKSDLLKDFKTQLHQLKVDNLIEIQCDIIRLSSKGLYVANDVFEKFI